MQLIDLFSKISCGDASPVLPDPWFSFFLYTTGQNIRPDLTAEFEEHLVDLKKDPRFFLPLNGPLPYAYLDEDGVARVIFPGFGVYLTSSALANDFRFLYLAKLSLDALKYDYQKLPVIFHLFYPGHMVQTSIKCSTWNVIDSALKKFTTLARRRNPGLHCLGCSLRDTCESFKGYSERVALEPTDDGDKRDLAQKLYLSLQMTLAQEQVAVEKRRAITKRFISLAEEGKIQVGEFFRMEVKAENSDKFPFNQVFTLLSPLGLWRDDYARINVRDLKKDLYTFPPAVIEKLLRIKFAETTDFNIREITEGNAYNVNQGSIFRGVTA